MRAAVFYGPGDIRVCDVPDPRPSQGDVVVAVERAGICGSDVNRFRYGSHPWPPGFIMGHEFCGTIVETGPGVTGWSIGQPVVVEPTIVCGACFHCRDGHPNRCIEFVRRGLTGSGTDGAFAECVRVPAYQLHRRPPALAPAVAALAEPTAVGVHGWHLASVDRPDAVVVVGLGNIGLLAVLVARAKGARTIIAIGKYASRQELARGYGADLVLDPGDEQLHDRVLDATAGLGASIVLEAAGMPSSIRTAIAVARKGGRVILLGVAQQEVRLDCRTVLLREIQILGSLIYHRRDFADALALLSAADIDVSRHVTATIPLEAIVPAGFRPLLENRTAHVKIQVHADRQHIGSSS